MDAEEQQEQYRRIVGEIQEILDANRHLLFGETDAQGIRSIPDWFLAIGSRTDTLDRPLFAHCFLASDSAPYTLGGLTLAALQQHEEAQDERD